MQVATPYIFTSNSPAFQLMKWGVCGGVLGVCWGFAGVVLGVQEVLFFSADWSFVHPCAVHYITCLMNVKPLLLPSQLGPQILQFTLVLWWFHIVRPQHGNSSHSAQFITTCSIPQEP